MNYFVSAAILSMLGLYEPFTDPCTFPMDHPFKDELAECASGYDPFVGYCDSNALAQCWVDGKDSE